MNIVKKTKKEAVIQHIMFNNLAKKEVYKDIIILTYEKGNIPFVAIWETKSDKPSFHYRYDNLGLSARDEFIKERKQAADRREADQLKREKKYEDEKKQFVPGAILYSSWGWEQTNIDFYVILERKNDFVVIQEIGQQRKYESMGDRGTCTPDVSVKIGDPFRKKITKYASVNLNSYSHCGLYNNKPLYWSSYA